jgi:hypothetical protein
MWRGNTSATSQEAGRLGEEGETSDEELAGRKDVQWHRIFVVPGAPREEGRIKDI